MEACLFCRIVRGEIGAHIIAQNEHLVAFLDIYPIRPGHTQIVSREHVAYFEELRPEVAASMLTLGQRLASAMKQLYGVPRVAFCFTGGDVAHAHAHVVPMFETTDITSRRYIVEQDVTFRSTPRMTDVELKNHALQLHDRLAAR